MNLSYYIHGHPTGFDYVGNPTEKDFFLQKFFNGIFSNQHANGVTGYKELRIELLEQNTKPYILYTYFVGSNITGYDGRPGYFAITIKSDSYYKRPRSLYFVLDSFVHSYLQDLLFDHTCKFKYSTFSSLETEIENSLKNLQQLIYETSIDNDFIPLSISPFNHCLERINTSDASDDYVEHIFKSKGEISISENHVTTQVQKTIQDKQTEIDKLIASYKT